MRSKGPWSPERLERFLGGAKVPARIALHGSSGHPVLASLWFLPEGDRLWCATQRDAAVVGLIERDPRCAYEVSLESPPYRGVRGSARAEVRPDRGEEILLRLIDRYQIDRGSDFASFLLSRVSTEVAIELTPLTRVTWDFTERMRDAL